MNLTGITRRRVGSWLACATALAGGLAATAALAAQPLTIIVPFGPGSGADSLARLCAPALQSALNTTVEVKHVTGSTGTTGIRKLLEAPADGRTMAVLTGDTFGTLAYSNARFKVSDLVPVAVMMKQPSMLFVPASSRFAKWQDMEKEARANPRALRVAVSGYGSPDYIALQQLAARNLQLTPVAYTSPQERVRAVVHGEADAVYEQLGDMKTFVDAGQFRPILSFGPLPMGSASVPTVKEVGLGEGIPQFRAFVVKNGTDPQTVAALAAALERIAGSAEYRSFLQQQHAAGDSFMPASAARTFLDRELGHMRKVVQGLPMHSQYLFGDLDVDELPPQF